MVCLCVRPCVLDGVSVYAHVCWMVCLCVRSCVLDGVCMEACMCCIVPVSISEVTMHHSSHDHVVHNDVSFNGW